MTPPVLEDSRINKDWFISKLVDQIFNESLTRARKERSASGGRRKHRRDIRLP